MKYAHLILRNLLRNKRRTILTTLSIALSLLIFSALVSLPTVIDRILHSSASSLRVACYNKAGLFYPLPEAYKRRILGARHVEAATAITIFAGLYRDPRGQLSNSAVDHEEVERIWPEWELSKQTLADFKRERTACIVAKAVMRRFRWRLGQQVMLRGTIYPVSITLRIVGTLGEQASPNALVFRRDYLDEVLGRSGLVNAYWIMVDRAESIPMVIAELEEAFANSEAETKCESEANFINNFIVGFSSFLTLLEACAVVVIVTIGLVAANAAAMSIRERRSEIAVMRAIGFSPALVLSCLLVESALVGLAGGLLGCAAALLLLRNLPRIVPALGPFGTAMSAMPRSILAESLVLAVAIGLLSAIVPAGAAARRSIVSALRHVV